MESFNPVMMPGVALLVLSTTMRMGNVRMSLFDLSRTFPDPAACQSCRVFERRMELLGRSLQLLYFSMLSLVIGSLASFGATEGMAAIRDAYRITSPLAFTAVGIAMVLLFGESRLAVQGALLAARDLREKARGKG